MVRWCHDWAESSAESSVQAKKLSRARGRRPSATAMADPVVEGAADEDDDDAPTFKPSTSGKGLALNLQEVVQGEKDLKASDFLTTARASNEVAITVRGDAKMKAKRILQLLPVVLGKEKVKAGWRPKGTQLAVACQKDGNCILSLYSRKQMPKPIEVHNLGPGKPSWLDWDCNGSSVAIMVVRASLPLARPLPSHLALAPRSPLHLNAHA